MRIRTDGKGTRPHWFMERVKLLASWVCHSLSVLEPPSPWKRGERHRGTEFLLIFYFFFSVWFLMFFPCRNWAKQEESRGKSCVLRAFFLFLWWNHHVWKHSKGLWVWHICGLWFSHGHCGFGLMDGHDHIGHLFQPKWCCGFTTNSVLDLTLLWTSLGLPPGHLEYFLVPWVVPSAPADLCHMGIWIPGGEGGCFSARQRHIGMGGTFPNNPSIQLGHSISPLSFSSSTHIYFFSCPYK